VSDPRERWVREFESFESRPRGVDQPDPPPGSVIRPHRREDVTSEVQGIVVAHDDERPRPPTWEAVHPREVKRSGTAPIVNATTDAIRMIAQAIAEAIPRHRHPRVPEEVGQAPATLSFATEANLEPWLKGWARDRWGDAIHDVPHSGTGRSSNPVIPLVWLGEERLLKISSEAETLLNEARHLDQLQARAGPSVVKPIFAKKVDVDGDKWAAYVMPRVGELSLRDYIFTAVPKPTPYLEPLCNGLYSLYTTTMRPQATAVPPGGTYVDRYLLDIRDCLTKLQTYAALAPILPAFRRGIRVNSGDGQGELRGPLQLLEHWLPQAGASHGSLQALEPTFLCAIHGDLHFENIRVDPRPTSVAPSYWLIDPKPFFEGDYVYDLAKLMSSLTGHAHVDRGRWPREIHYASVTSNGVTEIHFNCWLTLNQLKAFREAFDMIHSVATRLAYIFEPATDNDQESTMKRRLLLALARHFFSAARYFDRAEEQVILFARGATLLNLFALSLDSGTSEETWDPFAVCAKNTWLNTR
jgi:hypothetical protein